MGAHEPKPPDVDESPSNAPEIALTELGEAALVEARSESGHVLPPEEKVPF